jgi:hypothetical protein
LFGRDPDWGRSVELDAQVETVTSARRISRHRVMAPPVRTVEMNIASVIDHSRISGPNPTPDYILARTGGAASATAQATALTWQGIVRRLNGPRLPVVYLARVQRLNQAAQIINQHQAHVYGEIVGGVRLDNVLGLPLEDEAVRGARLTIREIR